VQETSVDGTQVAAEAAAPSPPASPSEPEGRSQLASLEDAFRSGQPFVKDGEDGADEKAASDQSAPPPGERVRQGGSGRRSAAARENLERIAELEKLLAERDPEKVKEAARAEWEAQQQQASSREAQAALDAQSKQDAEVFEQLLAMPDAALTNEQYEWRERRKAILSEFPTVEAHHRATSKQREDQFLRNQRAHLSEQLSRLAEKPGVERETFKGLETFGELGEHLYEAGRRSRDSELEKAQARIRQLEGEGSQYRLSGTNGLGSARVPLAARGGGRSSGGSPGRPEYRTSSASDLFAAAIRQSSEQDGA
jgi:hypothetical protein